MRRRLRRITEELGALSTGLPLSADSSVLLVVDRERLDVLRALLLPHPDTPYARGAFVFDIHLPLEYPDKPPLVRPCCSRGVASCVLCCVGCLTAGWPLGRRFRRAETVCGPMMLLLQVHFLTTGGGRVRFNPK